MSGSQGCLRISSQQRKRKNIEDRIIREIEPLFIVQLILIPHRKPSHITKSHSIDHFRIILYKILRHGGAGLWNIEMIASDKKFGPQTIDPVTFLMESVIAQFMKNIRYYKNAACDPDRKPQNIDKREGLVLSEIDKSDLQVILKHRDLLQIS
jgi:hypothetical protein